MRIAFPVALCAAFLPGVLFSAANGAEQPTARASPAPPPATFPDAQAQLDRFARARDNFTALRDGRLAVSELSPQELQDVIDFDRMLRGNAADAPSPRQQCVDDEVRRAGGRPSRLAWQVIALKCR